MDKKRDLEMWDQLEEHYDSPVFRWPKGSLMPSHPTSQDYRTLARSLSSTLKTFFTTTLKTLENTHKCWMVVTKNGRKVAFKETQVEKETSDVSEGKEDTKCLWLKPPGFELWTVKCPSRIWNVTKMSSSFSRHLINSPWKFYQNPFITLWVILH